MRHDTLAQALQAQARQSGFGMLDLGNLIDMLERDLSTGLVTGVHGAANAVFPGLNIGGVQQEVGGGRSTEVEGEGSVRTDSDTGRNRNPGVNVSSTSIELLIKN